MINCPECNHKYEFHLSGCDSCKFRPVEIEGFFAWAPELSSVNDGYDSEVYKVLAENEEKNFWFRNRNKLIIWAMRKYTAEVNSFLEVGCGTGFVLEGVSSAYPNTRICASEIHVSGLKFAAERLDSARFFQMDARKIPFEEEFDVIGAFDVIEHIEEDSLVLLNLWKALNPGGFVVITVPQHPWLWSQADEIALHKRRYTNAELTQKLKSSGFDICYSTSYMFLLLPLMLLSRYIFRFFKRSNNREIAPPGLLNTLMDWILQLELAFTRLGVKFPVGGSRLIVATKVEGR